MLVEILTNLIKHFKRFCANRRQTIIWNGQFNNSYNCFSNLLSLLFCYYI